MTQGLIDQLRQHIGEQGSDINRLERQLFIAERTVAEQKETITRVTNSDEHNFERWIACMETAKEQSALIEKLARALEEAPTDSENTTWGYIERKKEALADYEQWKGKV